VLVIAGVMLARLWSPPSASEQADAITRQNNKREAKRCGPSRSLAKAGKELAATRVGSAEHEENLKTEYTITLLSVQKFVANLWTEFSAQHGEALAMNGKEPQRP
jgi:hypothetical protein